MSDSEDSKSSTDDDDYVPSGGEQSGEELDDAEEKDNSVINKQETEEEKKKLDEVWNDFKKDTHEIKKDNSVDVSVNNNQMKKAAVAEIKNTVTVTKVYDFAGEEVKITKEVAADSKEAKYFGSSQPKKSLTSSSGSTPLSRLKRSAGSGGGIHSVLGKLGKKPKLSTLEKSKLDWQNFKEETGIHDELDSYKKGKDGYLEKQSFLQRTDMRQFEKERDVRMGRTTNRR